LKNNHKIELKFVITNKKCTNEIWNEIQRLLGAENLGSNFIVTGYLDRDELNNYLNNASLFLINKPNSVQNTFNFPTKISDYLNSGNPVIVAAEGLELNNFLIDGVNAIVVKPNDINEMSNAIIKLTLDSSFSQKLGSAGKLLAKEKLDYLYQANRIMEFINGI
jgi:glycosyltransferase involved in cell wall biosynthesis